MEPLIETLFYSRRNKPALFRITFDHFRPGFYFSESQPPRAPPIFQEGGAHTRNTCSFPMAKLNPIRLTRARRIIIGDLFLNNRTKIINMRERAARIAAVFEFIVWSKTFPRCLMAESIPFSKPADQITGRKVKQMSLSR